MKPLSSDEIRQKFIEYFEAKGHKYVKSSSLIPEGKDLLFTNAGMNQFKDIFLGLKPPPDPPRAVSVQKCFRATDLDQVGRTPRHHTFFEMLGNFSFGDYFKEEAIKFAWDFLTNHLGIEKEKLYVTVFEGSKDFEKDTEAYEIWKKYVPEEKIKWRREEDNFWRMASTGPCGPCSEIFYQHENGQDVEIWNLVFMQYNQISKDQRPRLPKPCVDTGAGLERLTAVMQGVESNFETDIFMSIFHFILWDKFQKNIQHIQDTNQVQIVLKSFLNELFEKVSVTPSIKNYCFQKGLQYLEGIRNLSSFHLFQEEATEMILSDLKKGENGTARKQFLNFLCEELQKDRSSTEDSPNQERDFDRKQKDCIALFQIADHIRAITFLLMDGVSFSNEGRGYVLREIFKKTYECLNQIGIDINDKDCLKIIVIYFLRKNILDENTMTREEIDKLNHILNTISQETIRYKQEKEKSNQDIFNKAFDKKFSSQDPTPEQLGKFAFECYETYGITKDNIIKYLQQKNLPFNKDCEDTFEKVRKKAQEHSRTVSQQKYLTAQKTHLTSLASSVKLGLSGRQASPHGEKTNFEDKDISPNKMKEEITNDISGEESGQKPAQSGKPASPLGTKTAFKGKDISPIKMKEEITNDMSGEESGHRPAQSGKLADRQSGRQAIRQTEHFVGYETLSIKAQVLKLSDGQQELQQLTKGQSGFVIFDQTPFYAEGGGQVGDQGEIKDPSGQNIAKITDCQKYSDVHIHKMTIKENKSLKVNDKVKLEVYRARRAEIKKHHTATHLLHASLKKHLEVLVDKKESEQTAKLYPGLKQEKEEVVMQRGSFVGEDHLRFDFTYSKALTSQQKSQIENEINQQIVKAIPVKVEIKSLKDAKDEGALAFFGEKYPEDNARVIKVGDGESIELCGGTHVKNTNEIQAFVITLEESISAGVRRIKALVGEAATKYLLKNSKELNAAKKEAQTDKPLDQEIKELKQNNKFLNRQMQKLITSQIDIDQFIDKAIEIEDGKEVRYFLDTNDRKFLSHTADKIKNKLGSGVVILFGKDPNQNKNPLIVTVTKNLTNTYQAPKILKQYGTGGGRPDFAQGYYTQDLSAFKDKNINKANEKTQMLLQHLKEL